MLSKSNVQTMMAAAALLASACAAPDIASPEGPEEPGEAMLATVASSRTGVAIAYVVVGGGNVDWYGFSASDDTGTPRGQFNLYQVRIFKGDGTYSWASVNVQGKVTCMNVVGRKARLGGVVTSSNFSGIPVGTPMTWSVSDNADGYWWRGHNRQWDTASTLFAGVEPTAYCNFGLAYPEYPILYGDLTIAD